MTTDAERERGLVLQAVFDNDKKTKGGRYLGGAEIAELLGLRVDDVVYHLDILDEQGYVDLIKSHDGSSALMTPAGRRFVREGVGPAQGSINIGNVIGTMLGGTAQGIGSATNSEVSQVVNDPALLREALDTLGNQLTDVVKTELPQSKLAAYVQAIEELKAELRGPKDPSKVRRLLSTVSLMGDIEGSLGLVTRVAPYVAVAMTLVQHLHIA